MEINECEYSEDDFCDEFFNDSLEMEYQQKSPIKEAIENSLNEAKNITISSSLFANKQTDLTLKSRVCIIEWLERVVYKIHFTKETLYNTVYILDQVLTQINVKTEDIQLTATVCLWLMAKIVETSHLNFQFFSACICQNQFTDDQFIQKELEVIKAVKGRFNYPTAQLFLEPFLIQINGTQYQKCAEYFLDLSLMIYAFVEIPPQIITVCAIIGAMGENCPIHQLCKISQVELSPLVQRVFDRLVEFAHIMVTKNGTIFNFVFTKEELVSMTNDLDKSAIFLAKYIN